MRRGPDFVGIAASGLGVRGRRRRADSLKFIRQRCALAQTVFVVGERGAPLGERSCGRAVSLDTAAIYTRIPTWPMLSESAATRGVPYSEAAGHQRPDPAGRPLFIAYSRLMKDEAAASLISTAEEEEAQGARGRGQGRSQVEGQ